MFIEEAWLEFSGKQIVLFKRYTNARDYQRNCLDEQRWEDRCVLLVFRERLLKPEVGNFLPRSEYIHRFAHSSCERSAM